MNLTVNNLSSHYDLAGKGPTVTFIHSLGMNLSMWDAQVSAFSSHFNVLRYDVRGHGATSVPPGPYSLEQMADDLYRLLAALQIHRTHVVGIAMGGMIAMTLALKHPAMVNSLIVSDTTSRYSPEAARGVQDRSRVVEAQGMTAVVDPILDRIFTVSFRESHPDEADRVRRMYLRTNPMGFIWSSQAIATGDVYDGLPSIACPTLVMVGEEDKATPIDMARTIAERIPRAELTILKAASHLASMEQPAAFNRAALAFLKRVDAA